MYPHSAHPAPCLYVPTIGWQHRGMPIHQNHPHQQQQQTNPFQPRECEAPPGHYDSTHPSFDAFVVNQVAQSSHGHIPSPQFNIPKTSTEITTPAENRVPLSSANGDAPYPPPPTSRSLAIILDQASKRMVPSQSAHAQPTLIDRAYAHAHAHQKARLVLTDQHRSSGNQVRSLEDRPLIADSRTMEHNASSPSSSRAQSRSTDTISLNSSKSRESLPGPMLNPLPHGSQRFCHGCQRYLNVGAFMSDTFDEYDEPWCVGCMREEEKVGWVGVDRGGALYKLGGVRSHGNTQRGRREQQRETKQMQSRQIDKKQEERDEMMDLYTREYEEAADAHDDLQEPSNLERQCGVPILLITSTLSIPKPTTPIDTSAIPQQTFARLHPQSTTKPLQTRCTGSLHCRRHNVTEKKAVIGRKEGYEVCVARLKLEVALAKEAQAKAKVKAKAKEKDNKIGVGRKVSTSSSEMAISEASNSPAFVTSPSARSTSVGSINKVLKPKLRLKVKKEAAEEMANTPTEVEEHVPGIEKQDQGTSDLPLHLTRGT